MQTTAVGLELRLTRTPRADATRLLRQASGAAAPQAGQSIAQERQLDLGFALEGVGVLGEDVEDHRGAIDRRAPEQLLEVELLSRRELVVEDDGVGVDLEADLEQLLHLPLAEERRRVGTVAARDDARRFLRARGVDEQ